jgi:hypothetical protein
MLGSLLNKDAEFKDDLGTSVGVLLSCSVDFNEDTSMLHNFSLTTISNCFSDSASFGRSM